MITRVARFAVVAVLVVAGVRAQDASGVVERVRWQPETKIEQALLTIGPAMTVGTRKHGEVPSADGRQLGLDFIAVQIGREGTIVTGLRLSVPGAPPLYLDNDEPRRLVSELRKAERIGEGPAGYEPGSAWVRSVGDVVFELPGRGRGEPLSLIRWPDRGQGNLPMPLALSRAGHEQLISLLSLADTELRRMTR